MRLINLRAIALYLGLAVLPAVLLVPTRAASDAPGWTEHDISYSSATNSAFRTRDHVRAQYIADRFLHEARAAEATASKTGDDIRVTDIPRPLRQTAPQYSWDAALTTATKALSDLRAVSPSEMREPVRVIVRDFEIKDTVATASRLGQSWRAWSVLPPALGHPVCVVLYTVEYRRLTPYAPGAGSLLGPCLLYGAFGMPGKGMAAYLAESRYQGAGSFRLDRGPSYSRLGSGSRDTRTPLFMKEMNLMTKFSAVNNLGADWGFFACGVGNAAGCKIALDPPNVLSSSLSPALNALPGVVPAFAGWLYTPMSSPSMMFATLGPDRFAKVWRSDKPLAEAYADATGQSLEDFAHTTLTSYVGVDYHAGPWPSGIAFLSALLLGVLALGLAIVFGRRPRVA